MINFDTFPKIDAHYLATYDDCASTEVNGQFKGLNLPEEMLYKLYYEMR